MPLISEVAVREDTEDEGCDRVRTTPLSLTSSKNSVGLRERGILGSTQSLLKKKWSDAGHAELFWLERSSTGLGFSIGILWAI
jgi:hypothetical protein